MDGKVPNAQRIAVMTASGPLWMNSPEVLKEWRDAGLMCFEMTEDEIKRHGMDIEKTTWACPWCAVSHGSSIDLLCHFNGRHIFNSWCPHCGVKVEGDLLAHVLSAARTEYPICKRTSTEDLVQDWHLIGHVIAEGLLFASGKYRKTALTICSHMRKYSIK